MSRIQYIVFIFNLLIILLVENVKCRGARINQGMQADNSFKYVVYVLRRDYENIDGEQKHIGGSTCTGSFITNQHVITAAHCVTQEGDSSFLNGEYLIQSGTSDLWSAGGTWSKIVEIYVPSFYRFNNDYHYVGDIAVLKLEQPLDEVVKVTLPKQSEDPPTGIHGLTAGYRFYSNLSLVEEYDSQCVLQKKRKLSGEIPRFLQYAESELLAHDDCVDIHKPDGDVITKHHLCTKMVSINKNDLYHGVCMGDSGSPLVIGDVQIGVASHTYSHSCNKNDRPQIYTKVSHFVNFITDVINGNIEDACVNTHIPKTTEQFEREYILEIESSMNQCLAK